jgi:hypothetical protein
MKDDDMDLANMNETGEQRVFARTPAVPFVTPARTVALGAPVPVHALTRRGAADSRMLRWGVSRARGDSDGQRGKMHA